MIPSRRTLPLAFALVALLLPWPTVASAEPPIRDGWHRTVPTRLLPEPVYRTQRDGSRYAGSNCGPAVLGMVLDAYGHNLDTMELRRLTHTYQGTWPGRGGTALQHMARVAEDFGLASHGLYDDDGTFHRWSVDEIAEQVALGRWVIPLVRYDLLPGNEGKARFGHYVLLYALRGEGFMYHDPAFNPVEEGASRWISRAQLDRAMNPVLVPRQAVALGHDVFGGVAGGAIGGTP